MHSKGTLPFQDVFRKQDKAYSCITRRQDLQDAFERHPPISRRVQKTRQDVFVHNKTPRRTRRIQKAPSHFKTRSEKQDTTYSCITRSQDLHDSFQRHAPISRRVQKARQDIFVHNKMPKRTRRIRKARSHFKTRSENKTRRIRALQDGKTYKTHSRGTLPFQDVFRKKRRRICVCK